MNNWKFSLFLCLISVLFFVTSANAAEFLSEIEEIKSEIKKIQDMENLLKSEMQKLLNRLEELERKQAEKQTKDIETEKKMIEIEKKAEKKSLKDRVDFSGEARFRILRESAEVDRGFYGDNQPLRNIKDSDETGFPTRIRLNAHVEIVPDNVDFYARLTMNKRWGAYSTAPSDPFDRPNAFESSIGHDMTPRFEQAYMTFKIPSYNMTWYIGRLPGMDGPPSRQAGSLFPRLFIDSEIDGSLIKWDAPKTFLDGVNLPWTEARLRGSSSEIEKSAVMKPYLSKIKDRTGIIVGYLKYDEKGISTPDDADAILAQAQIKVGKDTALILNGLYMDDWHMPNTADDKDIPDLKTPYWLTGFYADTQFLGCQLYGAYYYSHFKIPPHTWKDEGITRSYDGESFPGRIWYIGFNSGDLISPTMQLCVEYAKGDDAWINPFNYRGFRRKGTVQSPANNYFYNQSGSNKIVGFYPFNASVLDAYYDYYFKPNVRFRIGIMDFHFNENKYKNGEFSILGSNKYEHQWWPYFEVNLSF